jgi:hypothetical protein
MEDEAGGMYVACIERWERVQNVIGVREGKEPRGRFRRGSR